MLVCRPLVWRAALCLVLLSFSFQYSFSQDNRIVVNVSHTLNRIPPTIYGSCIEDVNHEIYGGFYAQLLFGESFEEPSSGAAYRDWRKYAGYWAAETAYSSGGITIVPGRETKRMISGVEIGVEPDDHARLIYEPLTLRDGDITFDIRFPEPKGASAGILLRASRSVVGENAFQGYGVSLSRDGRKMLLTKHNYAAVPELKDFNKRNARMDIWTLEGPLQAENLPGTTTDIAARHQTVNAPAATTINYTFPAYSYTILRFTKKIK